MQMRRQLCTGARLPTTTEQRGSFLPIAAALPHSVSDSQQHRITEDCNHNLNFLQLESGGCMKRVSGVYQMTIELVPDDCQARVAMAMV